MDGADAVVNLTGENLSQRWTTDARRRIRDSRIQATTLLARSIAGSNPRPRVFVSASAMGIYGTHRDDPIDERASLGDDFLASVCKEWEAATAPAADSGVRVAFSRTGLSWPATAACSPSSCFRFVSASAGHSARDTSG
jgi:NAD dependent epimerase/dehydratase family enzyme